MFRVSVKSTGRMWQPFHLPKIAFIMQRFYQWAHRNFSFSSLKFEENSSYNFVWELKAFDKDEKGYVKTRLFNYIVARYKVDYDITRTRVFVWYFWSRDESEVNVYVQRMKENRVFWVHKCNRIFQKIICKEFFFG